MLAAKTQASGMEIIMNKKISIAQEEHDGCDCDCDCPKCGITYRYSWSYDENGLVSKPERVSQKILADLYETQELLREENEVNKKLAETLESTVTFVTLRCDKCGYVNECFIDFPFRSIDWSYKFHCNFPMLIVGVKHIACKFIDRWAYNERVVDETNYTVTKKSE